MSRFVSGGTNEEPTERDEAWIAAQASLEAKRAEKAAQAQQNDGLSLYETLQKNKAAKQDAFEESIKLRNQFQSLDEDDVEFLDSVLESTRAAEAAVKKQTKEQLDAFRRQQEEAEQAARGTGESEAPAETKESWTVSRKRKKGREDALGGVKLRKASSGAKAATSAEPANAVEKGTAAPATTAATTAATTTETAAITAPVEDKAKSPDKPMDPPKSSTSPPPSLGLGLAAYSSDEDD